MKCNFVVGQKIELVIDFSPEQRRSAPMDDIILPELNTVYTVRELSIFEGEPMVLLVEVINRPRYYADVFDVVEQGFGAYRFRPLTERKSDISVFKAMLTPAGRIPVDA